VGLGNQFVSLHVTHSQNGLSSFCFPSFLSVHLVGPHHTRPAAQVHTLNVCMRLNRPSVRGEPLLSVNAERHTESCRAAASRRIAVMTWCRVEEEPELRPWTIRPPAGFKLITTEGLARWGWSRLTTVHDWPLECGHQTRVSRVRDLLSGVSVVAPHVAPGACPNYTWATVFHRLIHLLPRTATDLSVMPPPNGRHCFLQPPR
jgi:hypothetical protein